MELLSEATLVYRGRYEMRRLMSKETFPMTVSARLHFYDGFQFMKWFLGAFPAEMLLRALFLTTAGNWFRDRFFELGIEDTISPTVPPNVVGEWYPPICRFSKRMWSRCALAFVVWVCLAVILGRASKRFNPGRDLIAPSPTTEQKLQEQIEKQAQVRFEEGALGTLFRSVDATRRLSIVIDSIFRLTNQVYPLDALSHFCFRSVRPTLLY